MTIHKTSIPQPNLERWIDDEDPDVRGWTQPWVGNETSIVVEYGSETQRGFVQVPRSYAASVANAILAIESDLAESDQTTEPPTEV